jgi:adenylate cyclase
VSESKYGDLIPLGGGDPIPLLKKNLLVGRRESCDIVLRFANVSAHHCQLTVNGGYWYVRDLKSLNGVKVNDMPVVEKRLSPGDRLTIAKHRFEIDYVPQDLGAVGPPPPDEPVENVFSKSLLERAGLDRRSFEPRGSRRHDVTDDSAGKMRRIDDD